MRFNELREKLQLRLSGELVRASPEIQQHVRDMQEELAIELSNQSEERALVGEVISTVPLAGQISLEFNVPGLLLLPSSPCHIPIPLRLTHQN